MKNFNKKVLQTLAIGCLGLLSVEPAQAQDKPNVVIIFMDNFWLG